MSCACIPIENQYTLASKMRVCVVYLTAGHIADGILADFLKEHSSEVINMLTREWKLEEVIEVREQETREEYEPLLAAKDAEIAGKDAEIESLRIQLLALAKQ